MRTIALAALIAVPAQAQTPQCAPVTDALTVLEAKYQEAPRVSGLASNGSMMLITASESGGFSVMLVSPDGLACMVASGSAFEVQDAPKPGVVN
jgi:hypothetical protein